MRVLAGLPILFGLCVLSNAFAVELEGSKVFTIYSKNHEELGIVHNLETKIHGTNIWQYGHIERPETRIFVPEAALLQFYDFVDSHELKNEVFIENVKEILTTEHLQNVKARKNIKNDGKISFTAYHSHEEINAYLDRLAEDYPSLVSVESLGQSTEGRDIKVIRISTSGGNDVSKPVFLSDAGIHAREWIAPSTALYMIRKLVEDVTESDLVEKMDWVIVPLLNPDGYEHSRQGLTNRFWRKTRSTVASTTCLGVDGNRNFDHKWMTAGASAFPCMENYAGPEPFSEPEAQYLANLMHEYSERATIYMAIHSHGSYVIYPYSHDGSEPETIQELRTAARIMANAIDAASLEGSKKYLIGSSAATLNYFASGCTTDYAIGVTGIPYSYTLELPSGGLTGFDMPASRIEQVVKETWEGLVALTRHTIEQEENKK